MGETRRVVLDPKALQKAKRRAQQEEADRAAAAFAEKCRDAGLPEPEREHRFDGRRRWRFDFAWPDSKVALEVEGGVWTGGRHTRGAGFLADVEKYNTATVQGWRVLRCTPDTLLSPETLELVRSALAT